MFTAKVMQRYKERGRKVYLSYEARTEEDSKRETKRMPEESKEQNKKRNKRQERREKETYIFQGRKVIKSDKS